MVRVLPVSQTMIEDMAKRKVYWLPEMNKYINHIGRVKYFSVAQDKFYVEFGDGNCFTFLSECLERVFTNRVDNQVVQQVLSL